MRSIYLKLTLAFLGTSLISIVFLALSSRWATNQAFETFVIDQNQAGLTAILAEHFQENGSWEDFNFGEFSRPYVGRPGNPGMPFTLVDNNGKVIRGTYPHSKDDLIPKKELLNGIPIEVDGQVVGTLLIGPNPFRENSPERAFVDRTSRVFLFSALGAGFVALLLGIFFSRSISRPIRELTQATQAISGGSLGEQVAVRTQDELGQLAQSFNQMSADLVHSTQARRQMTADIAHELRTPLSVIIGHADAVHDGVLPPTRENFEIIREEAARLEHLVDDLRTLSLVDAGELILILQPVKPANLLNDIIPAYTPHASSKQITFKLELEPEIPPIYVDIGRFNQVLGNILDNALRYTPVRGVITLSARHIKNEIELTITDTGPGVSDDDLPRIFDRLFRSDESRQRDSGGSGLGLSIVRSLVHAHGGNIRAENKNGLRIIINLPIKSEGS